MDNIQEIKNYIVFLKENCKLEITLHTFEEEQLISLSELIAFNIHENSHCVYIKTFPDAHEHCICRQEKIKRKCKNGLPAIIKSTHSPRFFNDTIFLFFSQYKKSLFSI